MSILELLPMKDRFFERLESCKKNCVEERWEELFLNKVVHTEDEIHFYGFKLTRTTPLRNRRRQCLFTDRKRNDIIDSLIKNPKIRIGLDATLYESLKPLEKIVPSTLENVLEKCRLFIIPDMDKDQFPLDYYAYAAADSLKNYEFETPLKLLKILIERHPNESYTLKITLARVAVAKPHLADVEVRSLSYGN